MNRKIKIGLAAAFIAATVSPTLAQDRTAYAYQGGYHTRHEMPYAPRAPRFFEGRNAAVIGDPGISAGTSTDRESLVRAN